jgi:type II secretory pathway pseudopilin PulG
MQKINLIPEVKQQQLKTKKNNVFATSFAVVAAIILGAIILVLAVYIVARKAQIANSDSQVVTLNQQLNAYSDLNNTVLSLETGLSDIKTIVNNDSTWLDIFSEIEKDTPADIRFQTMNIATDYSVTAEMEGTNVASIDRFIQSFSQAQTNKKTNAFSGVEVDSYSSDGSTVTFMAKFTINKDAF